ncbi:Plasmid replication initiator protein [Arboricoccus pini]|uniref:Plasmid replication initiator protein n=1 Tax=Arboricoccus pini TaxID=1963835 RepID=A0A212RRA2_9PROT|nr:replication initiator protein A [Arboricoccus pini]SNB75031.1 Plasmid replication initiator protein [Arboricoccus pini]
MSRRARNQAYIDEQFDLFLPFVSDLALRDQRETMERPFFSLAKNKRLKPIDYTSPDGKIHVYVSANPDYGMATIWDLDILIFMASMISDMRRRGINDIPQTLHFMPYDLLRVIGRPTTGRAYQLLGQALDRLQSTTVKTNIRANGRKEITFSWIDSYTHLVDERTERTRGMSVTLARWFYDGLMMEGGVLSIDRSYFDISGGRERWLYRVARKHAGGAGESGFRIALPTLFEKSGAEGSYRRFKFELLAIAKRDALPGYRLQIEASGAEPILRMIRRDAFPAPSSPRLRHSHTHAPTDDVCARLRVDFPGWDVDELHRQFEKWLAADTRRLPVDYDRAFYGFVRRHHEREHRSG